MSRGANHTQILPMIVFRLQGLPLGHIGKFCVWVSRLKSPTWANFADAFDEHHTIHLVHLQILRIPAEHRQKLLMYESEVDK
jgi:hypothetical protein